MVHKVEKYIKKHNLLPVGAKVLVALSGGADSVALLHTLLKLGHHCEAIHCNFHLRGDESNRDEEFVRQLCTKTNVTLTTVHFDTAAYAREKGLSIEMAAREQRYEAFEKNRASIKADAIAVAHHRDDSAETLLLNLIRGTGIKGLKGIQPKNGRIIRPLLCVNRSEILDYLSWRGEDFVTDSTNLSNDYTRNKIRNEIIPLMSGINPSVLESIAATAQRISEAEELYSQAVKEAIARVKEENIINLEALKEETSPSTILHEILAPLGFNSTQTANILESTDSEGRREVSNAQWRVIKEQNQLTIAPQSTAKEFCATLPSEGSVDTTTGTLTIEKKTFDGYIPRERESIYIAADNLATPLQIRNTRPGDRFAPFGMRGTKLVSDYLTDKKAKTTDKERQLVVTDANNTIVWLVNERPSSLFSVKKGTRTILHLTWKPC